MIHCIDKPYTTEKTVNNVSELLSDVKEGKKLSRLFCIILSLTESDAIDIIRGGLIKGISDTGIDIKILGFATGKRDAYKLCREMCEEYIDKNPGMSMRSYFAGM